MGKSSYVVRPTKGRTIFVSWVEEFWQGQKQNLHVGRVEVERPADLYPSEEIRFAIEGDDYFDLRDKWDFKYISEQELEELKDILSNDDK